MAGPRVLLLKADCVSAEVTVKNSVDQLQVGKQRLEGGVLACRPPKQQDEIVVRCVSSELKKSQGECRPVICVQPIEVAAAFAGRNNTENSGHSSVLSEEGSNRITWAIKLVHWLHKSAERFI